MIRLRYGPKASLRRGGVMSRNPENDQMRKSLPPKMFADGDQVRLGVLRTWILDNDVTEIDMTERQFWIFAGLQPLAETPWTTFMGRQIGVPDMPEAVQRRLGIFRPAGNI